MVAPREIFRCKTTRESVGVQADRLRIFGDGGAVHRTAGLTTATICLHQHLSVPQRQRMR